MKVQMRTENDAYQNVLNPLQFVYVCNRNSEQQVVATIEPRGDKLQAVKFAVCTRYVNQRANVAQRADEKETRVAK